MNKKLSSIFIFAVGCLFMVSCSDDDENSKESGGISVISAETSIKAVGGSKTIIVSDNIASAYSKDSWLDVSAEGTTVNLTAGPNGSVQSRNTTVVIKASATDSTVVNVSQNGAIFNLEAGDIRLSSDDAAVRSFPITHELDVELTTSADWLTASVEDGELSISISENNSGHMRSAYVYYSCGDMSGSIKVLQCDFVKDIVGNYYFWGYSPSDPEKQVVYAAALTGSGPANASLYFPQFNLALPVNFNMDELSLEISAGQYMGKYDTYVSYTDRTAVTRYVWSTIWDQEHGYITWMTDAGMSGTFDYDGEEDITYLNFEDNGGMSGFKSTTFMFHYYTSDEEASAETRVTTGNSYLAAVLYPSLQSVEADSYAKARGNRQQTDAPAYLKRRTPIPSVPYTQKMLAY